MQAAVKFSPQRICEVLNAMVGRGGGVFVKFLMQWLEEGSICEVLNAMLGRGEYL
jgi:hypothetical protein